MNVDNRKVGIGEQGPKSKTKQAKVSCSPNRLADFTILIYEFYKKEETVRKPLWCSVDFIRYQNCSLRYE